jgi:nucleoid-associated protein YgaU
MGLLDFLNKGKEKPAPNAPVQPTKEDSNSVFDKPGGPVKAPVTEQPAGNLSDTTNSSVSRSQPVQATIYTVKSGDSLSKIAQQHYGDSTKWRKIFDANKDIIKDPNLIHPGQKLNIPR